MVEIKDILELKFAGNGINPTSVKPHEIAELIINFEKALLSTIKENNPIIDIEQHLVSFENLDHNSLDIQFSAIQAEEIVKNSYLKISESFASGDYSGLDNNTITSLRVFTKFSKQYNCSGYFNLNGTTISTFTPSTEIPYNKKRIIKENTTIFGKLIDVGGEKPNVHIKLNESYILIFDTSEANAKLLAPKLFETVTLKGLAKWDADTLEITDFKLSEIVDYAPGNTYNAILEIRSLTSGHWDKFNNLGDINNELLRD